MQVQQEFESLSLRHLVIAFLYLFKEFLIEEVLDKNAHSFCQRMSLLFFRSLEF